MIKYLEWDSQLFKKKIGEVIDKDYSEKKLRRILEGAKKESFEYLILRLEEFSCRELILFNKLGFYISDIGVTLKATIDSLTIKPFCEYPVQEAREDDIPSLKGIITSLFIESRFYSDPFFSKREADLLFKQWIENSVRREVADIVFIIPGKAFITCKKRGQMTTLYKDNRSYCGEIPLIGVKKGEAGKGMGMALISKAVEWFRSQNIMSIFTRTQLKNIKALNFYESLGFRIHSYDIVMASILKSQS